MHELWGSALFSCVLQFLQQYVGILSEKSTKLPYFMHFWIFKNVGWGSGAPLFHLWIQPFHFKGYTTHSWYAITITYSKEIRLRDCIYLEIQLYQMGTEVVKFKILYANKSTSHAMLLLLFIPCTLPLTSHLWKSCACWSIKKQTICISEIQ